MTPSPASPLLAPRLLEWYAAARRALPWRDSPTPYAVWVSEIMLQQTRADTARAYFRRWMHRFPTLESLAAASQQEALALWEGLGYYTRARNLHRAAQIVMERFEGNIPSEPRTLQELPGIGEYTAAAIASLAFGRNLVAVDANVRRVFARLFDVSTPLGKAETERNLRSLAAAHLPPGHSGDYNQALMDLGALVCTPKAPRCEACPLNDLCLARARGTQSQRPVRPPKNPAPHYDVSAAVIRRNGSILLARRPEGGMLGGLWEFPGGKVQPGETYRAALQREIREELDARIEAGAHLGTYRHAFTHFRITLRAYACRLHPASPPPRPLEHSAIVWVRPAEFDAYPMGKVDRQIARHLQEGKTHVSD